MNSKAVTLVVLSTVFFALMNVCIKMLPGIPSYEIVLVRSLISFLLSLFLLLRMGIFPFGKGNYLYLIIRGVAGSAALLIYFYTLQNLPLATAVTVQYLSPIFTVLFAAFLLKEKLYWQQWAFLLVSFAGIVLIRGFEAQFPLELLLLGVLSAALSGFAYNAVRKAGETEHALVIVFYLPLVTIPVITPLAVSNWVMPEGVEWFWLIAVGVLTQIAQVNLTRAYQLEKASNITPFTYLGILFAIFFGWIIFQEHYTATGYLGMVLVMSGVVFNYLFVNRITNFRRLRAYLRHFPGA
jgi:drug/metabolite transporter (DMT)-like permease